MKRSNTFLITLLALLTSVFVFTNSASAQLVGTKTIPGDYATIQLAVADLNVQGVGTGGVTFNVAAGYSESISSPIFIKATGTVTDPIVFQKSGTGTNPLITRIDAGTFATSTLGAQGDAVILVQGSDYLTFDGIDVASLDQGIEYGYYLRKGSVTNGCKFVTIKNAIISLTKGTSAYVAGIYSSNNDSLSLVSSATGITVTSVDGRNENVTITGNTIQNVFAGIVLRGYGHSTAPYDYYDQNYVVGSSGAANIIQNYGGNAVASAYGVYLIYHNNANVSYNTINNTQGGGVGATSTFYGIFHSTGTTSAFIANYNNINLTTSASASAIYGINTAATGNLALDNNSVAINTTVANSQTIGYLYNSSANASSSISISNNKLIGSTLLSTGSIYLLYNNTNQLTPGVTNVSGNSISGVFTRTGASGSTYCYYNNGSPTGTENIFNNVFDSINTASSSGALYGILSTTASAHTHNIYNNTVSDFVCGTGIAYGIHRTIALGSVHDNSVYNINGASSVYGISTGSGSVNFYNNNVYNLTSSSTLTTAGLVTGFIVSGVTNHNIYNNFISDLKAPVSASPDAIRGIGITATSSTSNLGLYYNTIYLNGTSAGANFGSSGIYHTNSTTNTTVLLDMRDNIIVNNCTPVGSGLTVAFRRSAVNASLNNYSTLSNNNDFYAGVPGVSNLIFNDGTNSDQTIAEFKTRVSPRESASFSENPTFINSTTTPYNLRINTSVSTQIESGGIPITTPVAITSDFDGDLRNTSSPDLGADEFNGTGLDLSAPNILYTNLINTGSTNSRTLVAAVTDASGVPTTAPGWPTLYWKVNSAINYTAVSPISVSGSDYTYNFGSGVSAGDTVKYFIVAQDNASIPNVGAYPSGGASGFTTNPPAANTPPTTPSSYLITQTSLAGDYTVGLALFNQITGNNITFERITRKKLIELPVAIDNLDLEKGVIKSNKDINGETQKIEVEETSWIPLENGKPYFGDLYIKRTEHPEIDFPDGTEGIYSTITAAVNDLNVRGVSGAVRFLLTDTLYSTGETFPITINITNENQPTATNTVTFKPNAGVTSVISGGTAQWVFGINGADYITFDGSNTNGGATRDLSIVNTYTAGSFNIVIALFHDGVTGATFNTVKNCIIKGSPTPTSSYGLFLNAGGGGFHNTSFINNKIQNSKIGIQFAGILGSKSNAGLISGNIIGDVMEPLKSGGILSAYTDNLTIIGNEIFGEALGNTNFSQYGVLLSTGSTNAKVVNNKIHDFYYTGTSGYGCFGIRFMSDATSLTEISNNFIYNIKADGDASSLDYTPAGIYVASGGNINLFYNSIYLSGDVLGKGTSYTGRSNCLSIKTGVTLLDIRNNIFQNSMGSYPGSTMSNVTYGVYSEVANTVFNEINYNNYYINGVAPYVGYLGSNQVDINAWRIATTKDLNSVSGVSGFVSSEELHIPNGSLSVVESAGTPIVGITTDIDAQTRNVTKPDIGADEFNGINSTTALSGNYYVGVAGSGPGGSDPQFATLKEACDTLNTFNVSGNTTFYITSNLVEPINSSIGIDPGAFTVTFKPYTGTVDTITFTQVADNVGVSGGLVLGTPTLTITSATNYGLVTTENIIIDGSNTVSGTTRDLVFVTATGINGNTNPIRIIGDVNNCTIKNVIVQTNQSVSYGISITNRFFTPSNWTPDNIIIENCSVTNIFGNAAQGIAISNSGTPTAFPNGMIFRNNDVFARTRGIFLNFAGNTDVYNNRIRVNQTQSGSLSYGIWGFTIGDTLNVTNIYNNQITLLSTANSGTGFGIIGIEAGSRGTYNIYNNMITGFTTTTATTNPNIILIGIRLQGALVKANVFHNSIYMPDLTLVPGTGAVLYSGLYIANGTNIVKNNIVHSDEVDFPSYCIYRSGALGTLISDYNDYFIADTTGFIGYWNTAATKTLANWQVASGLDANTLNVTAPFTTASDLHIADGTSTLLESAGTPIASVTTDIDGQARNLSTPDIGADEFTGLIPLNAPTDLIAVADTFRVSLSWTDNSTNELGFILERKNGDTLSIDPYVVIDSVGINVVAYIDSGRTPFTTYTYRVKAYSGTGVSFYSNEATATTIIPVELTTFAASVETDNQISVVWSTATELNNSGFNLERKLDSEWQKVAFIEGKGTTTEKTDYSFVDKFKYESFQGTIQYRLKQIDFDGTYAYSKVVSVEVDFTPKEYTLYQNYPNPFNPSTTIKFALPFDSKVRIVIYNLLGEQVDILFDDVKEIGYHNVNFNASSLASGVYIYTIDAKSTDGAKDFSSVKKMMLIK